MKLERIPEIWSLWGFISQVALEETLPLEALPWHSEVWGPIEPSLCGTCLDV